MISTLDEIPTGDKGIFATIEVMKTLVKKDAKDPIVRGIAKDIKSSVSNPKNKFELAKAVFDFVCDTVSYKYDHENVVEQIDKFNKTQGKEIQKDPESTEFLITPRCLLSSEEDYCGDIWEGDCDDLSMAFCGLCSTPEINLPCTFKIIDWKPGGAGYTHVYPEVGFFKGDFPGLKQDIWVPADPVIGEFGKEKGPADLKSFRWKAFIVNKGRRK